MVKKTIENKVGKFKIFKKFGKTFDCVSYMKGNVGRRIVEGCKILRQGDLNAGVKMDYYRIRQSYY